MEKTCRDCGQSKPIDEFHKDSKRKDGHAIRCKPCLLAKQAIYQMRPPRKPTPPGTKRCTLCKETKPEADFSKARAFHDGLARTCRTCANARSAIYSKANRADLAASAMRRYYANEERYAGYGLKRRFGLTIDDYNRMLAEQDSRCAICRTDTPGGRVGRFHVDHCHTTNRVRALLCEKCNQGIGMFHDDPNLLLEAAAYLERFRD